MKGPRIITQKRRTVHDFHLLVSQPSLVLPEVDCRMLKIVPKEGFRRCRSTGGAKLGQIVDLFASSVVPSRSFS